MRGEVGEDWREMLSALAPYIDSTRPSGEFYHLAVNMGLLNKGAFWCVQVERVHKAYKKPRRR